MGGRVVTPPLHISDHTSQINRRGTLFNDLWSQDCYSFKTGLSTLRTSSFTLSNNDELLGKNLDLIEERRKYALVQLAYYQHKLKQGYNANVKLRPLAPRNLVIRKVLGTTKNPAWEKLEPNWKGPYRITSVAGISVYHLVDLDEDVVPCSWNVNNLKMYYY